MVDDKPIVLSVPSQRRVLGDKEGGRVALTSTPEMLRRERETESRKKKQAAEEEHKCVQ